MDADIADDAKNSSNFDLLQPLCCKVGFVRLTKWLRLAFFFVLLSFFLYMFISQYAAIYIYICMSGFVLWNMLVFCVFASCLFSFMKKLVNHTACILIYALVDEYRGLYFPIYWYIADYNNPIGESLLTNQYDGMIDGFWTLLTCSNTAKWILLAISPLGPHSSTTNIPPFYHHFP